jgi:hypothetical protein
LHESIADIEVEAAALAEVRELINRRTVAFLARLEQELTSHGASGRRSGSSAKVRLGLSVFSSEQDEDQ